MLREHWMRSSIENIESHWLQDSLLGILDVLDILDVSDIIKVIQNCSLFCTANHYMIAADSAQGSAVKMQPSHSKSPSIDCKTASWASWTSWTSWMSPTSLRWFRIALCSFHAIILWNTTLIIIYSYYYIFNNISALIIITLRCYHTDRTLHALFHWERWEHWEHDSRHVF